MKCAWIARHRDSYPIDLMCRLLSVARSSLFSWLQAKSISPRQAEGARLVVAIQAAHARGRGSYGPAKIRKELAEQDLYVGINRIKRLRKELGIRCKHKRKFKATTDSRHTLPVATNRLAQRFTATRRRIRCGWPTSLISQPMKAGCIWRASRIYTPASW